MKLKKKKQVSEEMLPPKVAMDYSVYMMSKKEKAVYILGAGVVLYLLGYIFYRNMFLSLALSVLAVKYPKIREQEIIDKRRKQLRHQFKDMIYSMSSAISAGNSPEHALELTLEDLENQYGDPNTYIIKELELMVSRISLNKNIEEVMMDFGKRSGIEDIQTFASIFEISKRISGNTIQIIRQTSAVIADKIDVELEMETMLAGKKMEQKVLTVIPVLLVFVLTQTTGEFMAPLFITIGGRIVSTAGLIMIGVAAVWSQRITNIEI